MPLLYINGVPQAPDKDPCAACQCEWCGEPLAARPVSQWEITEDHARFYKHPPIGGDEDVKDWGRGAVFLVRLCKVCVHIFAVMNDDDIRETPTGPYFPTEDEKHKIIRIRGGAKRSIQTTTAPT